MVKRTDEVAPNEIVELSRQYIHRNLAGDLKPASIAKAIGIGVQDLKGSYRCTMTTSIRREVKKIRLHALYEEVKINPLEEEEKQIKNVVLKPSEKLLEEFEQEFWISLQQHREHSKQHHGHTIHAARRYSADV